MDKKIKLLFKGIALLGIVGLLLSCGGGNTTTPTDPNLIFGLSKLNSMALGTVYSVN